MFSVEENLFFRRKEKLSEIYLFFLGNRAAKHESLGLLVRNAIRGEAGGCEEGGVGVGGLWGGLWGGAWSWESWVEEVSATRFMEQSGCVTYSSWAWKVKTLMRVFWHHDFKICECESGTLKKLLRDKLRWREAAGDYRGHWTAQDKWELQAGSNKSF